MKDLKRKTVQIDIENYRKASVYAKNEGRAVSNYINYWLKKHLEQIDSLKK